MEEILASIRRIISEDDATPAPVAPVLELSMPAAEAPVAVAPPPPDEDDLLVFDHVAEPEPAPPPPVAAPTAPKPQHVDSIISQPTVTAAAGSFTRLAGSLRLSDTQGQSLEGVVRELLRPMLRDWLEQNLPAIVESKVEAELDRISRLAR